MHDITIILLVVLVGIAIYFAIKFLKWLFAKEVKLLAYLLPAIIIVAIIYIVLTVIADIFGLFIH